MVSRPLSQSEQRIVGFVESHGCFVNGVFDPMGVEPEFAYSIGFPATLGQPDVLVSGLNLETMQTLINDLYKLCGDGLLLKDWGRTDRLLASYDCIFRKVASEHLVAAFWNSAIWYQEQYRGERFTLAYQIVWPDRDNRFPWDKGFDENSGGGQLKLWEVETVQ